MPHTLHLTKIDPEKRASAARGIRDALRRAGYEGGELAQEVQRVLDFALAGEFPIPLVSLHDRAAVESALSALVTESRGAAEGAIDLSEAEAAAMAAAPARADDPDSDFESHFGDDEDLSVEAASTALMLLSHSNGNIPVTYVLARSLARTTGDEDLYAEVCRLIATTFDMGFSAT